MALYFNAELTTGYVMLFNSETGLSDAQWAENSVLQLKSGGFTINGQNEYDYDDIDFQLCVPAPSFIEQGTTAEKVFYLTTIFKSK